MIEKEVYTPEMLVAGVKEYGSVNPQEAAFNALAFTLDTESVALIYRVVDNRVHYAGAPSSYFVSKGESESPVYHVLGAQEGAYIIDEIAYSILIIKSESHYETYSATFDQVRQTCQAQGLEPVILDAEGDSELGTWETMTFEEAKRSHAINKKVAVLAGLIAIGCSIAWVGMSGATGALEQSAYNYDLTAKGQITKVIQQIPTYQPIDEVLADLSIAKSVAAKSGGWIDRFDVKDNRTGIQIMMPAWVTRDYIAPLGNVKAERDPNGMLIKVYRKLEEGK